MSEVATSEEHAEFCERVKARRKELGLTQSDLAERLGVSQPAYAYLELGRNDPTLSTVVRLSKALECSVIDLIAEPVGKRG